MQVIKLSLGKSTRVQTTVQMMFEELGEFNGSFPEAYKPPMDPASPSGLVKRASHRNGRISPAQRLKVLWWKF